MNTQCLIQLSRIIRNTCYYRLATGASQKGNISVSSSDKILLKLLSDVADVVEFTPTQDHRRAKSNFWLSVVEQGISLPSPDPDLATVAQFAGDRRIAQWWDIPGFQDWFLNRQEFRQRVDAMSQLALDEMERILISTDPKTATAKVAVIRMALEASGKLAEANKSREVETTDEKIAKMTQKELEEFIRNRLPVGLISNGNPQ